MHQIRTVSWLKEFIYITFCVLVALLLIQFHFTTFIADPIFISPIPGNQFMLNSSEDIYPIDDTYCPYTPFCKCLCFATFPQIVIVVTFMETHTTVAMIFSCDSMDCATYKTKICVCWEHSWIKFYVMLCNKIWQQKERYEYRNTMFPLTIALDKASHSFNAKLHHWKYQTSTTITTQSHAAKEKTIPSLQKEFINICIWNIAVSSLLMLEWFVEMMP